jgi:hypothetical protein
MPRRAPVLLSTIAAVIALTIGSTCPMLAQEHVTFQGDVLLYGDNTEFRNAFREGETILGTAVRAAAVFTITERVRVSLGAFGNVRFGGDDAFEVARPIVSLTILGRRSAFVFGTLPPARVGDPPGPDRTGPHGLLPPLQRETLAFDRPYEAGLAWTFTGDAWKHEMWIDWQRVNTPDHRERFDAGATSELKVSRLVFVPVELHIVHEGGQLYASGPVADSAAFAAGLSVRGRLGPLDRAAIEVLGLGSRFVPDRGVPSASRDGEAIFSRASAERAGWRAHLIVWRGRDFIKVEGDPNYQSIRRDGSRYGGTRDYSETGVTRTFRPAPGVLLEASARLHRIERHYEYSFRIVGTAAFALKIR